MICKRFLCLGCPIWESGHKHVSSKILVCFANMSYSVPRKSTASSWFPSKHCYFSGRPTPFFRFRTQIFTEDLFEANSFGTQTQLEIGAALAPLPLMADDEYDLWDTLHLQPGASLDEVHLGISEYGLFGYPPSTENLCCGRNPAPSLYTIPSFTVFCTYQVSYRSMFSIGAGFLPQYHPAAYESCDDFGGDRRSVIQPTRNSQEIKVGHTPDWWFLHMGGVS